MSDAGDLPAPKGVSGLGIASLVLGLLALPVAFVPCLGIFVAGPLGLIGLVLGLVGLIGKTTGKGIPISGAIISVVAIAVAAYWWIAAGAALSGVAAEVKKEGEEALKQAKAGESVTVTELLKAYKDDAKKADDKYKDKWLKVKGKVELAAGLLGVTLKSDDKDVEGSVNFTPVAAEVANFSKLTKGQEVTLGGKCDGMKDNTVTLKMGVVLD